MSQLIADCPRCGSSKVGFDLVKSYKVPSIYNPKIHDCFCICRGCQQSVVFSLRANSQSTSTTPPDNSSGVNRDYEVTGFQTLRGRQKSPPDYVPQAIKKVFDEGAMCLSVKCWNAGATMFRMCLDLATKELLPVEPTPGLKRTTRRSLGHRLEWLLDNKIIPEALRDLSQCVKDDGNAGAHDGTLSQADAEDLMDFTFILLERLYTEPKRLELAAERRTQRHKPSEL